MATLKVIVYKLHICPLNSNLAKIGTIYTGNPIEVTISGAYNQDAITDTITLTPGTYIFIIKLEYNIAKDRSVMAILSQSDWNLATWFFNTEKDADTATAYGKKSKTFTYVHKITTNYTYKVEIGINWVGDGETNIAQALLQAVKIG